MVGHLRYPNLGGKGFNVFDPGLFWLAGHQDDDGHWDAAGYMKHDTIGASCTGAGSKGVDVGVTALALLAFLGDGQTTRAGRYKDVVKCAVAWLVDQQLPSGHVGEQTSFDQHALATLALCECAGHSKDRSLAEPVRRALDRLFALRQQHGVWGREREALEGELGMTAWSVLAWRSAQDFSLSVDPRAGQRIGSWLDSVTDPTTGLIAARAYVAPAQSRQLQTAMLLPPVSAAARAAAALLCRSLIGQEPNDMPVMHMAAASLVSRLPARSVPSEVVDFQAQLFATFALYRHGGQNWRQWSKHLMEQLLPLQRRDGNFAGSWDPDHEAVGKFGGRIATTALAMLTVQTCYRYTRLVR